MTKHQQLFLVQARSAMKVFELLRSRADLPHCHALHYLQMATELLGKAEVWKTAGPHKYTHCAFVDFLRNLATNRRAQRQLNYARQNDRWQSMIKSNGPLAARIENLAPKLAEDGPNPEYPWPPDDPQIAPAQHTFELWEQLEAAPGRKFLQFVRSLFAEAEAFL